jgi:hypothetical protein
MRVGSELAPIDDIVIHLDRRIGLERFRHGIEFDRISGEKHGGERNAHRNGNKSVEHGSPLFANVKTQV